MVSSNVDDCYCIMDYSFSFHMTPNHVWFRNFTKLEGSSILPRDNKSCKIIRVGITKICLNDDGFEIVPKEVRLLPSLKMFDSYLA